MDFKINQLNRVEQPIQTEQVQKTDDTFKFTLISQIGEKDLAERLSAMMKEITQQGQVIGKKKDIREMKRYRSLIKGFMNEVTTRSHSFSRENFLDRKGRHRVYGMLRRVDETLDELAQELMKDEQDHVAILAKIGEIEGLLLDIFT